MAKQNRMCTTKADIIKTATRLFLEQGYTNTSSRQLCAALDISPGNLTFHFSTKEHLLAILVDMLCDHQWKMMEQATDEGKTSLMALCLELIAIASICEENEITKDLYLSAYSHPMTLEIIRKNDKKKAKLVFAEYCKHWTEENFTEAETLVSGIEYATLMTTASSAPLHVRIAGALHSIMLIYNVPEETRRAKIQKVLEMDYRAIGRRILHEFVEYTQEITEHVMEEFFQKEA